MTKELNSPKQTLRQKRREAVANALQDFETQPLLVAAQAFWKALGYSSERRIPLTFSALLEYAPAEERSNLKSKLAALNKEVSEFELLFQFTTEDVRSAGQPALLAGEYDQSNIESYLFLAVRLKGTAQPPRSALADMARTLNRAFAQPALILFVTGQGAKTHLSLTAVQRRVNKRDSQRDVLGKVTLVYDVPTSAPRRSLDVLTDLHLDELLVSRDIRHFVELERAWGKQFAVEALNKRFYEELSYWFHWAASQSNSEFSFPDEREKGLSDAERLTKRHNHLIRLITRLIFVWFLREKDLVPDQLFQPNKLRNLLKDFDPYGQDSTYYQAILQNLFFATLNTHMGDDRRFMSGSKGGYNAQHGVSQVYRYPEYFANSAEALKAFANVPFLNGGLFECLDRAKDKDAKTEEIRIDGFSTVASKRARIPNALFFTEERQEAPELNDIFGTKNKRYEVRGLITLLDAYKFTTTENTPIEEEVALDPELLGKVFENLLASVTEDTQDTARKKTGSFYTPRYVVNDMTDSALLTYFERHLRAALPDAPDLPARLSRLLEYTADPPEWTKQERQRLVQAVDELDIIDPACGSGAFPMGALHKLVYVLGRVDPQNQLWRAQQREREIGRKIEQLRSDQKAARHISEADIRAKAEAALEDRIGEIEKAFDQQYTHLDYARKLFLIENCIYGVDLQPIAVQISKLRCFISLVVDQRTSENAGDNRGILPLPNLESQFVAANTLKKINKQDTLFDQTPTVTKRREDLKDVRHQHFLARSHSQKRKLRSKDRILRERLAEELKAARIVTGADASLLADFDPYDQNASAPFFDPAWMFNQEEFDIVIGNPPYVRQERIKDDKPWLKAQYGAYYDGKADLFVYFFARGMELLKDGGVLTYICSNKFFRSGYGKSLRTELTKKTLLRLLDFGDAPVFDAIAYPSILAVQEAKPAGDHQLQALTWQPDWVPESYPAMLAQHGFALKQKSLRAEGWQIENQAKLDLLERLRKVGTTLGKFVDGRFYRGVLTGLNEAFVVPREVRDRLIKEDPKSAEVLKPYLRGRDVKRWVVKDSDQWLIFTRRGIKIDNYPAIKRHLEHYKTELMPGTPKGRKAGSYEWYEIQDNIAYYESFAIPKIMYQEIATFHSFAWDESGAFSNNKTYIIPGRSKALLSILNSKIIYFLLLNTASKLQGGALAMQSIYLETMPIPKISKPTEDLISRITDGLLLLAAAPATARGAAAVAYLERVLDALVYELYLPEDLHAAGYNPMEVIGGAAQTEGLPDPQHGSAEDWMALSERWYGPEHPVRRLTYYLDSVEAVRIIEGKEEGTGSVAQAVQA